MNLPEMDLVLSNLIFSGEKLRALERCYGQLKAIKSFIISSISVRYKFKYWLIEIIKEIVFRKEHWLLCLDYIQQNTNTKISVLVFNRKSRSTEVYEFQSMLLKTRIYLKENKEDKPRTDHNRRKESHCERVVTIAYY